MRRSLSTILGAAAFLTAATTLPAQQWNLDAQAGRIHSALDPSAAAEQSVVLGVRYDDVLSALRVFGGIPTASGDPLWGAAAAAHRFAAETHGFTAGVDVAGNAFLLHDRVQRTQTIPGGGGLLGQKQPTTVAAPSLSGSALAAQTLPLIGYDNGTVQAFVRAGVSAYTSNFAGSNNRRTVRMADAQVTLMPSATFALMPVVRYYALADSSYTYAGATAVLSNGPLSVWGTAGTWMNQGRQSLPWAAGASLRVHERAALNVSARNDVIDPLYGTPPQSSWNIGVSILLGGKSAARAPVPAHYEGGTAIIELAASQAKGIPNIAGDFTSWKPVAMQRVGSKWIYRAAVRPGVYNFAFVGSNGEWFVPQNYPGRKDDGMGGTVAVVVVQK